MSSNTTNVNIVLVHGTAVDGSSWSKVIPILQNAGHKVIAAQLPLHSLADDVNTVKRAISLVGGPVILVGHSCGGFVISNAAYNNSNVTGLVCLSAFAPNEGQSKSTTSRLNKSSIFLTQLKSPSLYIFKSRSYLSGYIVNFFCLFFPFSSL